MIEWKKEQDGLKLFLSPQNKEAELIAVLWRGDATKAWLYTSEITGALFERIADKETSEPNAKLAVEQLIYNKFHEKTRYYQGILEDIKAFRFPDERNILLMSTEEIQNKFIIEYCPFCEREVPIYSTGITHCPNCETSITPCAECETCGADCPYGCCGADSDKHLEATNPDINKISRDRLMEALLENDGE